MKKFLLGLLVVLCGSSLSRAQGVINLHSIHNNRQPTGDNGYTLNGFQMMDARQKLLNVNNFGASGTYPKSIAITDGYQTSGSLGNISANPNIDLFYFGIFNTANPSLVQFTQAEKDSLYAWSVRGGKLIIGAGSPVPSFPFFPEVLNSNWGFDLALLFPTPIIPTTAGAGTTLFNGPFGSIGIANQGGGSQGYFTIYPADIVVLADDGGGNPTMYLDCATLDLIVADGDAYTSLGNITSGNQIISDNDVLWANTIAYMDALESPPAIQQNGSQLSVGTYNSYQWYLNGNVIPGANSNTYTATQAGNYSVQVALSCGCNNVASQIVTVVGAGELAGNSPINISPNPAGNQGIDFSGVTNQLTVSLYATDGKRVDEFSINSLDKHYNTDHLKQGIYFLKMHDLKGNPVAVQKLVIR